MKKEPWYSLGNDWRWESMYREDIAVFIVLPVLLVLAIVFNLLMN